jgi:betaine-aldehyde dehydrogenase
VFNVVQGDARTGQALVAHPGVAKVSLTGEVGTGKLVMAAGRRDAQARHPGAGRQVAR